MTVQQEIKQLRANYNWLDRLESLGYGKDEIINILINENRKQGNLINIVSLLEVKEGGK